MSELHLFAHSFLQMQFPVVVSVIKQAYSEAKRDPLQNVNV